MFGESSEEIDQLDQQQSATDLPCAPLARDMGQMGS